LVAEQSFENQLTEMPVKETNNKQLNKQKENNKSAVKAKQPKNLLKR
jgi:hypothetical protein